MKAADLSELLRDIKAQRVFLQITNANGKILRGELEGVIQKRAEGTILVFEPWYDFEMTNKKQGERL